MDKRILSRQHGFAPVAGTLEAQNYTERRSDGGGGGGVSSFSFV